MKETFKKNQDETTSCRAKAVRGRFARRLSSALMAALLLFTALSAIALTACKEQNFMPKPAPSSKPYATQEVMATPEAAERPAPYKGDGSAYVNIMADEHNIARENDIVLFADTMLDPEHGHPRLTDREVTVHVLTSADGFETESRSFYEPELREEFIKLINDTILNLPLMNDNQVVFELSRAVALVDTQYNSEPFYLAEDDGMMFPFMLDVMYEDGENYGYYITKAKDSRYLMNRIDEINGVSIHEIAKRMSGLFGMGNLDSNILHNALYTELIMCRSTLRYLDVINGNDETAVFTLTNPHTGETSEVTVTAVEMPFGNMDNEFKTVPLGKYGRTVVGRAYEPGTRGHPVYKLEDDGNILYVKFGSSDNTEFIPKLTEAAESAGNIEKLIVDFRDTSLLVAEEIPEMIAAVNAIDASEGKYILIDHTTGVLDSCAAAAIRRYVDGAKLVGTPAGVCQLVFDNELVLLENLKSGMTYASGDAWDCDPDGDPFELLPDEFIGQSAEDYENGYNTLMKTLVGVAEDPDDAETTPEPEATPAQETTPAPDATEVPEE